MSAAPFDQRMKSVGVFAFVDGILESGVDYCSCPEECPHHGKCRECVLIHRGHRDHLPYCLWDMVNERLYAAGRLTEGSLKRWKAHGEGVIPRQYPCPPDEAAEEGSPADFAGGKRDTEEAN